MQVRVKLFGEIGSVAGRPEAAVEVAEGGDVAALLAALDQMAGRPISASLLFDEKTLLPSIALLVNGNNVLLGKGLATSLKDGDSVAVMPLMGGGA